MPDAADEFREQMARMLADLDQAQEATKGLARLTAAFYFELMEAGIDSDRATALTMTWLTTNLQIWAQADDEEDET